MSADSADAPSMFRIFLDGLKRVFTRKPRQEQADNGVHEDASAGCERSDPRATTLAPIQKRGHHHNDVLDRLGSISAVNGRSDLISMSSGGRGAASGRVLRRNSSDVSSADADAARAAASESGSSSKELSMKIARIRTELERSILQTEVCVKNVHLQLADIARLRTKLTLESNNPTAQQHERAHAQIQLGIVTNKIPNLMKVLDMHTQQLKRLEAQKHGLDMSTLDTEAAHATTQVANALRTINSLKRIKVEEGGSVDDIRNVAVENALMRQHEEEMMENVNLAIKRTTDPTASTYSTLDSMEPALYASEFDRMYMGIDQAAAPQAVPRTTRVETAIYPTNRAVEQTVAARRTPIISYQSSIPDARIVPAAVAARMVPVPVPAAYSAEHAPVPHIN